MEYMRLSSEQQADYLQRLSAMGDFLSNAFASLSAQDLKARGPNNEFAPIEQVWHLADLEKEGFYQRIARLLNEDCPRLPDFDGTQAANERDYLSKDLQQGLEQFSRYRQLNLRTFAQLSESQWLRRGDLGGVGEVSLCDMPGFLLQHDEAHQQEIVTWQRWHETSNHETSDHVTSN